MEKLGPHVIRPTEPALSWSRHANIVKAVDTIEPFFVAPNSSLRIFRHYFDAQRFDLLASTTAVPILQALKDYRHPNLYVEVYNEVNKANLPQYIRLLDTVVSILHARGVKVCGPSWATGDYEQHDWDEMRKANWCGLDAIALHAYWGNKGFSQWHALRFASYWREGDPPIVITECGRDAVEGGEAGWKLSHIGPKGYLTELKAYDAILQRYPYVLGAAVFTAGPTMDWGLFSTDELEIPQTTTADLMPKELVWVCDKCGRVLYQSELAQHNEVCGGSCSLFEGEPVATFQIGNKQYESLIGQLPVREGATPYRKRSFGDIQEITIHHSGSDTKCLSPMTLAAEMTSHQDPSRCEYPEIPYHGVIDKAGKIIICHPLDKLTWHADGQTQKDGVGLNNWRGIGYCLIGDFTNHPPTDAQLSALAELCPETDFAMGKTLARVRHLDIQATACPGDTSRDPSGWYWRLFPAPLPPLPDKPTYTELEAVNDRLQKDLAIYKEQLGIEQRRIRDAKQVLSA